MTTATKKRIIDAAIEVFNQNLSAPLQQVADTAGITRRTLHRYFKDRNELVAVCEAAMETRCKQAMIAAIDSTGDPLTRLEAMMYAGIDCGAKYTFFYKLHRKPDHQHSEKKQRCSDYNYIYRQFNATILNLQEDGIIAAGISTEWAQVLHAGIIAGIANAGVVAAHDLAELKKLAWASLMKALAA